MLTNPLEAEPVQRRWRIIFVILAFIVFMSVPLYQAARIPRQGDDDILRVGMMVLNRFGMEHFEGDLAMEAGLWWPYYTPGYLTILGALYSLIPHFEWMMFLLVAFAYGTLLSGFYVLGRKLRFSFAISLLLAFMSGLYVTSALGAPWTGLRLDMAAARNLYQALLPWTLIIALHLYRHSTHQTRDWGLFGLLMGALTNLHPLTGTFMIGVFSLVMVAGILARLFRWHNLAAFVIATIPGLLVIAFLSYLPVAQRADILATQGTIVGEKGIFYDLAKANLFFYRPPNWWVLISLYSFLNLVTGAGLLVQWRSGKLHNVRRWWLAFGVVQLMGALFLQTVDWLVLWVTVEWLRRNRKGDFTFVDTINLLFLVAINVLILTVGGVMGGIAFSGIFPPASPLARALIRGVHLPYATLIIFSANTLWTISRDKKFDNKLLFLVSAIAVFIVGFHTEARIPPLEGTNFSENISIVGQLIPVDIWMYLGVFLLLLWSRLSQPLRLSWAGALVFQALTRILTIPADDVTNLLVGLLFFGATFLWKKTKISLNRRIIAGGTVVLSAVLFALPISGDSMLQRLLTDTPRQVMRNWSRIDYSERHTSTYEIGTWIAENTSPGSLIVSDQTYLRYWMLRPLFGGSLDSSFLFPGSPGRQKVERAYEELNDLWKKPSDLVTFCRDLGADYIVLSSDTDLSGVPGVKEVYAEQEYSVYEISR